MKIVIDFIVKYWDVITSLVLVIASIIIMLIKKKRVVNEMDNIILEVLNRLPRWINAAENLKGADIKKSLVLESAKKFVKDQYSMILPDGYISLIGSRIEEILSTPQKHEKE